MLTEKLVQCGWSHIRLSLIYREMNKVHQIAIKRNGSFTKLCKLPMEIGRVYKLKLDTGNDIKLVFVKSCGNKFYFADYRNFVSHTFHGGQEALVTRYRVSRVTLEEAT